MMVIRLLVVFVGTLFVYSLLAAAADYNIDTTQWI
jgi:hypothetical protein